MDYIDLRSDTVTKPTKAMLDSIATTTLGDDVYEDDEITAKLEDLAAKKVGKEAAIFTPSGTMANQIAILCHTNRGDEIILSFDHHIVAHEVGGAALLSGVNYNLVNNLDSIITSKDIEARFRDPEDIHYPSSSLVCLENPLGTGKVVSIDIMADAYRKAKELGLNVHLDGARLFNAATYLNVDPKELASYTDTLMFCLSKGLCAPIGSMLCGDASFIKKARKYRKLLGGGMRQVGVLAAPGIIALLQMTKRLHTDHQNAKILGEALSKIKGIEIDLDKIHINLVFFKIVKEAFDHENFVTSLLNKGIKVNSHDDNVYRFVTHNDITIDNINFVIQEVERLL